MFICSLAACLPSELTTSPSSTLTTNSTTHTTNGTTMPTTSTVTQPVVTVEVGLSGKIDTTGTLLEDIEIVSDDGFAILHLAKGTRVIDAEGNAPEYITVVERPRGTSPSGEGWWLCGFRYDFSPKGVTFDTAARLTIKYDPSLVNLEEVNLYNPRIGYFDESSLAWAWLEVTPDWDNRCLTVEVSHTGIFVVSFKILPNYPIS